MKDRSGATEVKEVINWSDEERAKFRSIAKSVWEDYAKLSPLSQEAYDLQINYLRDAGLLRD